MEPVTENYKVVIIKKPIFIKEVSEKGFYNYIINENYEPILRILYEGPNTLSVIVKRYNEIITAKNTSVDKKISPKTDNTIYKYIKKLIDEELVIEHASQIDMSKSSTATKTLYSLSASYYLPELKGYKLFSSDVGKLIAEIIGVFLSKHYNDKFPIVNDFRSFIVEISKNVDKKILDFFKSLENIHDLPNVSEEVYNKAFNNLNNLSTKNYMAFYSLFNMIINYLEMDKSAIPKIGNFFTESKSASLKDSPGRVIVENDSTKTIIENDNFKQEFVLSVSEDEWKKYFDQLEYHAIFKMLREKAMTIHEIYSNHYKVMKSTYDNQKEMAQDYGKEIPPEPSEIKSETTIYRYVKELVDAGYLADAGRLFSPETKTSQILYARVARIYIMYKHDENMFDSKEGDDLLNVLASYLTIYLNKTNCDLQSLHKYLKQFFIALNDSLQNIYSEVEHDSIIVSTLQLKHDELDLVLATISFFEFFIHVDIFNSEEIITGIRNSFS